MLKEERNWRTKKRGKKKEERRKKRKNSPPLLLHAVPALQPLVLTLGKVGIFEDPVPFSDHVVARELPVVAQEPQDLVGVVVLMDHFVVRYVAVRSVVCCRDLVRLCLFDDLIKRCTMPPAGMEKRGRQGV